MRLAYGIRIHHEGLHPPGSASPNTDRVIVRETCQHESPAKKCNKFIPGGTHGLFVADLDCPRLPPTCANIGAKRGLRFPLLKSTVRGKLSSGSEELLSTIM